MKKTVVMLFVAMIALSCLFIKQTRPVADVRMDEQDEEQAYEPSGSSMAAEHSHSEESPSNRPSEKGSLIENAVSNMERALKEIGYDPQTDPPIEICLPGGTNLVYDGEWSTSLLQRVETEGGGYSYLSERGFPLVEMTPSPIYTNTPNMSADQQFETFLAERETSFPVVEPEEGMIPIADAITIAQKACPEEFDPNQRPRVALVQKTYSVTLWAPRKGDRSITAFAAIVLLDAFSGDIEAIQTHGKIVPCEE